MICSWVDINVDAIWSKGITGNEDAVVAVLDTGVDYNHPDLKGNMWINEYQNQGLPGEHGYNFVDKNGNPMDDNSHGTHCAGIIGAVGNNGIEITGVNQKAKIMALKFMGPNGRSSSGAIDAYQYMAKAKNLGVNIIAVNDSWGNQINSRVLLETIDLLGKSGVMSIIVAGNETMNNDFTTSFPASFDSDYIIDVGALDYDGQLAYFSNYGARTVDVVAPEMSIYSTTPTKQVNKRVKSNYDYIDGTSTAAPMVTGSFLLLNAYNKSWTNEELKARLIGGTVKTDDLKNKSVSDGYLDLGVAVNAPYPVLNRSQIDTDGKLEVDGYFFASTGTLKLERCKSQWNHGAIKK